MKYYVTCDDLGIKVGLFTDPELAERLADTLNNDVVASLVPGFSDDFHAVVPDDEN